MSLSVRYLPSLEVMQISKDGGIVFIHRNESADLLAKLMRALTESMPGGFDLPEEPQFSVKVPDDRDAYPVDDPKHPDWHDNVCDLWDSRDR